MHAVELTIGDYVHRLPLGADETAVLAELREAVQAGGGVVDLPSWGAQSTVAVLMSPGVPVFVERHDLADDAAEGAGVGDDFDLADWVGF